MTTPLITAGVYLAVCLVSFILYIIVLVKLFKNEGLLKGLLGFFIGLYTFIWGWLKHKELKLTKIMITWTVLILVGVAQVAILGTDAVMSLTSEMKKEERRVKTTKMDFQKARAKKKATKKKAAKKEPDKNVDWNHKAQILWKDGKYTKPDKALTYLNNFVKLNPESSDAYNNRGIVFHNLDKNKDAIKDFDKAIEIDPEYTRAYHNRGNAYYALGEYESAIEDYTRALELNRTYALAHINRGLTHYQMDNIDNACGEFSKACELGDCEGLTWAEEVKLCR